MAKEDIARPSNFIKQIVEEDLRNGKNEGRVHTRFPPEPNGYLHIGHAKSICLNFGLAAEHGGKTNLRMDDTNPEKEEDEYVKAIVEDVRWLGFDWEDRLFYASDYYDQLFDWAVKLVKKGKAYVCDLTADQIREYRGSLTAPGKESPYRNRSVEENLELFERMRKGEFPDGTKTLRAKIDMASGNINMRDPVLYRILRSTHHRTGDKWCIYPMYDYAHGQSDSIEKITHSICTLEFEDHRPLYNWFLDELEIYHPQQIEFARLNLTFTVMSKRKLLQLVKEGLVKGWDDPRMPTICGMRRLGYPPEAIREFCERIGVAKANSTVDIALLEHCVRERLNLITHRVMAVLHPLKVVITNYPEGKVEQLEAINNPENEADGSRTVPFCRELYIEQEDFREDPPKKYFRLAPGAEVRLKFAYIVKCEEVVKDAAGKIVEVRCSYDPETKSGSLGEGRKVKGTLHWVSAQHAVRAEVRLYDRLFHGENPDHVPEGQDWKSNLNPDSLEVLTGCLVEPALKDGKPGERYQFMRTGYFSVDLESKNGHLVFNRIVGLRDTWAKIELKRE
jgi:glutaminyl-tRNA synthetase